MYSTEYATESRVYIASSFNFPLFSNLREYLTGILLPVAEVLSNKINYQLAIIPIKTELFAASIP